MGPLPTPLWPYLVSVVIMYCLLLLMHAAFIMMMIIVNRQHPRDWLTFRDAEGPIFSGRHQYFLAGKQTPILNKAHTLCTLAAVFKELLELRASTSLLTVPRYEEEEGFFLCRCQQNRGIWIEYILVFSVAYSKCESLVFSARTPQPLEKTVNDCSAHCTLHPGRRTSVFLPNTVIRACVICCRTTSTGQSPWESCHGLEPSDPCEGTCRREALSRGKAPRWDLCRRLSGLSSTSHHRAADALMLMLIELATAIQLLLWPHYIILPSSSPDNSIAHPILPLLLLLLGSWCFCLGGRNFTLTHWFAGERIMFFLHAGLNIYTPAYCSFLHDRDNPLRKTMTVHSLLSINQSGEHHSFGF
ncbi:hypothetical protein Pelo_18015 [Pelomyxa schiedti]|nr:hypothetical protein Pelo_18015 [Pelomyxa schiedti]